jgi:hypothetical protein
MNMMKPAILSLAYLGTIGYFSVFAQSEAILIEQFDSYHKQTYRNRCRILATNGPLDLIIPVIKNSGNKSLVKDVRIDYSTKWQNNHWRSLFSAYNSSPFFEYYSPLLEPFYMKRQVFLLDFNLELTRVIIELLQINANYKLTSSYEKEYSSMIDLRDAISPKRELFIEGIKMPFPHYTQIFGNKFGFVPNLSIVDLLFNCGPDSESILLANNL